MPFVNHPLLKPEAIEEREYQKNILATALNRNTLCVLPTGTGKTAIAVLLATERLQRFPDSRALIMAPTRPLCAQHQKAFQNAFNLPEEDIILITGKIPPPARARFYKTARIIVSTPQCIEHDLANGILDLKGYSVLVVDECHRSTKKYAYPAVAKAYVKDASNPRILGLTASPGSDEAKINEIRKNLSIEAVEIRTETDTDVTPYVKEIETEWVKVDLPQWMKDAQTSLKGVLKDTLDNLKRYDLNIRSKKDVLLAQKQAQRELQADRNPICFHILAQLATVMKVWHALELLETQSLAATRLYFIKLTEDDTKSAKRLLANPKITSVIQTVEGMYDQGAEHPKMRALAETVSKQLLANPKIKIIVFSHYRDNIERIRKVLDRIEGCRPAVLIGQAGTKGMSQKEQIDVIRDYNVDVYNCLIGSPVSEEGLHVPSADVAIFYEPVPSEIRMIQRRGRVGRTKIGRIIFLLTKGTRDEVYYYIAKRKEAAMKEILKDMQEENGLRDFV